MTKTDPQDCTYYNAPSAPTEEERVQAAYDAGWQAALAHERARAQGGPVAWVNESYRDSILEHTGKVYWHGPMMCGKEFKGSFPVYLAAPARPVAVPDGWRLVPVEPTPEMMAAACASGPAHPVLKYLTPEERSPPTPLLPLSFWRAMIHAVTPAMEAPPSTLDQPYAWWAETGTAGAGDGCNKPFWLRHEAVAYVCRHGGYVAPLFRRWSAAPAAARSAAEEMRTKAAKLVFEARGEFGSIALAERIMGIPLAGEEA